MPLFWSLVSKYWFVKDDEIPKGKRLVIMAHTYGIMNGGWLVPATEYSLRLAIAIAKEFALLVCMGNDAGRNPALERDKKQQILIRQDFQRFQDIGPVLNSIQEVLAFKRVLEAGKYEGAVVVCEAMQARRIRMLCRLLLAVPFCMKTFESEWPSGNWNKWHDSRLRWLALNVIALPATWALGIEYFRDKQVGGLRAPDSPKK